MTPASQTAVQMQSVDVFVPSLDRTGEGRTYLLRDVSWTVLAGEHWVVLGPNGAGKSTLLSLASARRHPSRGTTAVLGGRLGSVDVWSLHRRIGVVEWRLAPPPYLEVGAAVASGISGAVQPRREDEETAAEQVAAALTLVDGTPLAARRFGSLSRGEQARVLIARALVGEPELLVLDEPAVGLDLPGREDLLGVLARLADERPALATILVAHLLEEVAPTTTHALLLSEGRIVRAGPVDEVLAARWLSACYGRALTVSCRDGTYSAVSHARATRDKRPHEQRSRTGVRQTPTCIPSTIDDIKEP